MQEFQYLTEQFDDVKILRYQVPAFAGLELNEKVFVYYLSRAALAGRNIIWDQNNRYNLRVRGVLEWIIRDFSGDRATADFQMFLIYAKKVFFANGVHHHYSMDKFIPEFTKEYFQELLANIGVPEIFDELDDIVFNPSYMAKRVVLDKGKDLVKASANNFYSGVTQKEAEDFYNVEGTGEECPVSRGLNSTLVKENGVVTEKVWKIGGKYGVELSRVVDWLEKALPYAGSECQREVVRLLIEYYRTGDLKVFDEYSIAWLKEYDANVDFINGFIEVYGDPLGYKGSWESVVQIVDHEACGRTKKLADNALWFEEHAPVDERFRKKEVTGVIARVMQVAMLGGDSYPATPIGINLPNAEWIRERYGSKSVTFDNITSAYDQAAQSSGVLEEFAATDEEKQLARQYGALAGNVHTDLHECLGHGSGRLLPGVTADALKNYSSTIEEARADLFALYYMMDEKLVELGVIPSLDVAKSEYNSYIRNGLLVQLTRLKPGDNVEESHMRNRQMIAAWVYEQGRNGNVIERVVWEGKTFFVIRDFNALRGLFARLLAEVQRIKSEGDYEAARDLVEAYGVNVEAELHREVLNRYRRLNVAPYSGFLNPEYRLVERDGIPVDVEISYPDDYLQQMLSYSGY